MPVLLSRSKPDHIAGMNLLNQATLPLNPSAASCNNQRLSKRMRMPRCTRARLKGDAGSGNQRRVRCLKKRVNPYRTRKPI